MTFNCFGVIRDLKMGGNVYMGRHPKKTKDDNIIKREKPYFETLSKNEQMMITSISKYKQRKDNKEKALDIAELVREVGRQEYVTLEDGTELTINDILVATAYGNALRNKRTSFRELNDAQKVINNDTQENNAVTINFVSNGQDLGD